MECGCVVEDLRITPFERREFSDKLAIVNNGRPQPKLELSSAYKDKNREYTRHFNASNYIKTPWLTGCSKQNKVFCWPCLLFSNEKSVWSRDGFSDLNNLCKAIAKHEKTKNHITCFFKLQVFGDCPNRIDLQLDHQHSLEITKHNELVKGNRCALGCLINAVCFLAKQELPSRGHNDSLNKGNYIKLLNYTAQYDLQLNDRLQTSTVFQGTSSEIHNDLISAIAIAINDAIKAEVKESKFVSILLDETSDISNVSQLSICLRYVNKQGIAQERFLSFFDVSSGKASRDLLNHVESVVNEFGIADKIIGQTYDGAPVVSGNKGGLQMLVRERYPEAVFVHCYNHILNVVLQQSVKNIKECNTFFIALSEIASFFSKSPKRINALKHMVEKKLPKVAPTRWNFSSRLVNTVKENKQSLTEFFEFVVANAEEWDSGTVLQAGGCAAFLRSFLCCFMLQVFSSLFSHTDILYDILQTKCMDIIFCCERVEEVKKVFRDMRENGFERIWNEAQENTGEMPRKCRNLDPETAFKVLFNEIMDTLNIQLEDRFGDYKKLEFTTLLDSHKFLQMKTKFPESAFTSLLTTYNKHFDSVRLRNELTVLYSSSDQEMCSQPLHLLVKYMNERHLMLAMPEVYKLAVLILTIPATTATVGHTFSALKRIKSYTRSTQGQERMSGLALISIEKGLMEELRNNPTFNFNDAVIKTFCSKTRRMEFMFK